MLHPVLPFRCLRLAVIGTGKAAAGSTASAESAAENEEADFQPAQARFFVDAHAFRDLFESRRLFLEHDLQELIANKINVVEIYLNCQRRWDRAVVDERGCDTRADR